MWLDKKINFWWLAFFALLAWHLTTLQLNPLHTALVTLSFILSLQALVCLYWSLFAWNRPETVAENSSPSSFSPPRLSFTAIVPAYREEAVIAATLQAIARINYPSHLVETLVVCRSEDTATISQVQTALSQLNSPSLRLLTVATHPINKPHQLNFALTHAQNDIVVVFDAEDSPHPDIYHIANTVFTNRGPDILQAGVQLVNFRSHWFSPLNVLEYYFWFKSALHFFASQGVIPLGGNTVFFKRLWLTGTGGWDETCLTEDAEIGFRLSLLGAKTAIVYDPLHATQEETPPTLSAFIKQRTRWYQGFLQIFFKADWLKFPRLSQKLLAGYLLFLPQLVALTTAFLPFSLASVIWAKVPLPITLVTFLPAALLLLQLVVAAVGLFLFTRDFRLPYPWWINLVLLTSFLPYFFILNFAALRASFRQAFGHLSWEKTAHVNAHRRPYASSLSPAT